MKRVFVDTGAWYSLVDAKDPDHRAVAACLAEYHGRLATSNFVFDETVTLLRYRLGYRAARTFGAALLAGGLGPVFRLTPADEAGAWEIFTRYRDKRFSFTDCTSFALIKRLAIGSAVAIDDDFRAFGIPCLPGGD